MGVGQGYGPGRIVPFRFQSERLNEYTQGNVHRPVLPVRRLRELGLDSAKTCLLDAKCQAKCYAIFH
ncbi:hypothetical protein D3C73_1387120 [compost metagenome]